MTGRSLRMTWAWAWALLALTLFVAAAAVIAAIALTGNDSGDVALAVALIGFPAVLAVFALGTLAMIVARPTGGIWRALRRWGLALAGGVALLAGVVSVREGGPATFLLIAAGASALAFLALDLRRGRGEE